MFEWVHWQTGNEADFDVEKEVEKILQTIGSEEVNIIGKSVGTLVTVLLLPKIMPQVSKIILCGIPVKDMGDRAEVVEKYKILSSLAADKVLCIQNENDNHGGFDEVEKFIHSINPEIQVIKKSRSDHEYPYPEDFQEFLK